MNESQLDYFWLLDRNTSSDEIQSFLKGAQNQKGSDLHSWLTLLASKVPLPPRAFISADFFKVIQTKITSDALNELGLLVNRLEHQTHCQLGGRNRPLLLTVKGNYCGAIRNIGVCPESLVGLLHSYGSSVAYGLYVDFLESYSNIVLGSQYVDFRKTFGISVDRNKMKDGLAEETSEGFLKKVKDYQNLISKKIGKDFPEKPEQHLLATLVYCARAVKKSGKDEVSIQVQLNRSNFGQSVHGVAYTRNPFSGNRDLYGVFQIGPEGRKAPLEEGLKTNLRRKSDESLRASFPTIYNEILVNLPKIESAFSDVMEAEFVTDEDGHLNFIQFYKAETTARAAVITTVELNREGLISDREAAMRLKSADIETLLHPSLDDASRSRLKDVGSVGVSAAPGTAIGHVFFKMKEAMKFYQEAVRTHADKRVILITDELLISDTPGLGMIQGLVTKVSGIASHAAVMARTNGIPCIVGYRGLELDSSGNSCRIQKEILKEGTLVTLEAGPEGRLFLGEGVLQNTSFKEGVIQDVSRLMSRIRKEEGIALEVRVNINNAKDAEVGLLFGAEGVGLCRTENMFMEAKALKDIRNIIFTNNMEKCKESLAALEEVQFTDFKKIFETMGNRVVNIRLMDLPLHDFAPKLKKDFKEVFEQLPHLDQDQIWAVATALHEHNPMLGLRASRFGLITPEVYDLQIRAIIRAAYAVSSPTVELKPGIMFPLVFLESELSQLKRRVFRIEEEVRQELKVPVTSRIHFRVGSMIELPAAALSSDRLAAVGEFFAFGTNDLTQTTLGMSRDDSAHYLPPYLEMGLLPSDPFKVLHGAVRELIEMAVVRGRRVRPDASFGICGEQGGDSATLLFCLENNLDYVSCSPFRVLPVQVSLIRVALAAKIAAETDESQELLASNKGVNGPSGARLKAG